MPDKFYIAAGASFGFIAAAFFLSGFHHEIKWRLKQRRYGGWL